MKIPNNAPKSRGLTMLRRRANGERLTRDEAIAAKCCECSGYYLDGRTDCSVTDCALYPYMPYRKGRKVRETVADPVSQPQNANLNA